MTDRVTGTVKSFNAVRGYGFLLSPDVDGDAFVHYRSIQGKGFKTLTEGQAVEFLPVIGAKGWQAAEVVKL